MTPAVYVPPLPLPRPRYRTGKADARRGRHRDPAFRGTAPDHRITRRLAAAIRTAPAGVADILSTIVVRVAAGMSIDEAQAVTEMEHIAAEWAEAERRPN